MGSELTSVEQGQTTLKAWLESKGTERALERACAGALDPAKLTRIALTEVFSNDQLGRCEPTSMIGALLQSAELGLYPGKVGGLAYLIPRRDRDTLKVNFQPSYRGLAQLAWRDPAVVGMQTAVVREGDSFEWEQGTEYFIRHKPAKHEDQGDPTWVYAIVHTSKGKGREGCCFEVMSYAEVERVRGQYAYDRKGGPWETEWDQMAQKTAAKRALKLAPIGYLLSAAISLDDMVDAGIDQGMAAKATIIEEDHPDGVDTRQPADGEPPADYVDPYRRRAEGGE